MTSSGVGVLHVSQIVVVNVHIHLQVGGLHHLGVPVIGSVEIVVDRDPRVNQNWLTNHG